MTQRAGGRATTLDEPSDDELMARLASGDQDALGPLHGRYAPLIFNLAARSLGQASADEIVQDVFVAVWRRAATFDPGRGSFRSWALRIAHNRVLNELRRQGRQPRIIPDLDGSQLGNVPDQVAGPEDAAWLDHCRAAVRAAVDALPPPQRQALSLAFLEDLTHRQVSDALNLPMGTAKTRIRAGLKSLRVHLAPLMAAGLALVGLLAAALVRDRTLTETHRRDEAALRLVTSSDVVPLRLSASPGEPAETHGNYRARPGFAMAVETFSRLWPAPRGGTYHAWGMYDGRWHHLGTVHPDPNGSDLLVIEGPHLATRPTELRVTVESVARPDAPTGKIVMIWRAP